MNIDHISVSRKQLFDQCRKAYYYRYHIKQESLEPEPEYFHYGKIVHKIAEIWVGGEGKLNLNDVCQDVLNRKIPIDKDKEGNDVFASSLSSSYKKRFPGHIRSIASLTEQIGFGGELEYKFHYDLDPPNEKFVTGFIDRIIERQGTYFILDYKTSKKSRYRKTRTNITHDLQLRVYARVVQREFNVDPANIRCALHYVEGGDIIGAKFSEADLAEMDQVMLDSYNQIEACAVEDAYGSVNDQCRRCGYRKICPYYSLT